MSTLNIQVIYDDKIHQFNLVRENLNWGQLTTVLQSSIPQVSDTTQPLVLHYGLDDGEVHEVHDQDTFSRLLSFPGILVLCFYGNMMEDKNKMKSVYILPPNNDAFKKLADFVDEHYYELENNHPLSRVIGMLASSMSLSPGNYDNEMKQLECFIMKLSKNSDYIGTKLKKHGDRKLRKHGHKLFKKIASRQHGSYKFSPYFFMNKHHRRHGFPHAPLPPPPFAEHDTELNGFVPPPPLPFERHRKHKSHGIFGGHHGHHAGFEHPNVFFDFLTDEEQDDDVILAENNEKVAGEYKDTPAENENENENESESEDNEEEEEEEEFLLGLPFSGPNGRPSFRHGSRGGFRGRGGHGRPFGRSGFGGPSRHHRRRGEPNLDEIESERPGFGNFGFHGRGGFGGRGGGGSHHGRGGYFGKPKCFGQGPNFHHIAPHGHKHFYFA